ncbi:zf-HC2 domain-containing protein [Gilvimarinus chinensis]|uniref:zf-HC2 domain-containing protein n=1 Tax=Gilvimarinus chinensis TaxID=396005 RepID=UPI000368663D|nr:zf-HC2 domain-containing protein [Gilvimarinus chinensis]
MLKCRDLAHRASEYLDGSADKSLRWQIRLHLAMCRHCRRFVKHLQLTRQLTGSVGKLPAARDEQHLKVLAIMTQKPPEG